MPSADFWLGTAESKDPQADRYADRTFQFRLARMLNRTREELLLGGPGHRPISNHEYEEWAAFLAFESKHAAERNGG